MTPAADALVRMCERRTQLTGRRGLRPADVAAQSAVNQEQIARIKRSQDWDRVGTATLPASPALLCNASLAGAGQAGAASLWALAQLLCTARHALGES